MEVANADDSERVSIMTLHGAKGLEFETVFLPGWEEGLFPHQRSLDDNGRAGLEEERRLAYVGLTRAKRRARIYFATNRRIHGLWQTTIPSRFLDELPEQHVEVTEAAQAKRHGSYGASRFDRMESFGSPYATPGWQRAQRNGAGATSGIARLPGVIEGELLAKSTGKAQFSGGARVLHTKFGPGTVAAVDGNKLTVDFDQAGRKMVLDSFVQARVRAGTATRSNHPQRSRTLARRMARLRFPDRPACKPACWRDLHKKPATCDKLALPQFQNGAELRQAALHAA